jgi:hypothetical protein
MNDVKDYEVGKGKPPKHSQFKKGQSGNPGGRPRKSRNMTSIVEDELSQKVKISENGRTRLLTKRQLVVKRLVADSIAGKPRSTILLIGLMEKVIGFDPDSVSRERLSAEDETILQDYARSLLAELGKDNG